MRKRPQREGVGKRYTMYIKATYKAAYQLMTPPLFLPSVEYTIRAATPRPKPILIPIWITLRITGNPLN